jgi:hypothetical protein
MRKFLTAYIFHTRTVALLLITTAAVVTALTLLIPSDSLTTTALVVAVSIPSVFVTLTAALAAYVANNLVSQAILSSNVNRVL